MKNFSTVVLGICLVVLLVLLTKAAHGEESSAPDFSKALLVTGEINGSIILVADQLEKLSRSTDSTIRMIINSPGGGVEDGLALLSAMDIAKARGKTIECIVTHEAASMAFHTLARCDVRYTLPHSIILYHEVYAGSLRHVTATDAENLAIELASISKGLDDYAFSKLGGKRVDYDKFNKAQRMWTAEVMTETYPKFKLQIVTNAIFPENFNVFSEIQESKIPTIPFIIPGLAPSI